LSPAGAQRLLPLDSKDSYCRAGSSCSAFARISHLLHSKIFNGWGAYLIETAPSHRKASAAWLAILVLGVVLRIAVVALPGNQLRAPWSGGGDAPAYVLLAQNLLDGRGFTYALQPTALRAPGYPVILAALMWLFGPNKYALAVRWIQFFLGLGTVYFCSRASARVFGEKAGRAALVVGLFFPTLIYITGEVLTECIGAFLASLFLYLLVKQIQTPQMHILAEMGLLTGFAALFRFNMAALLFIGLWVAFRVKNSQPAWLRCLALAACAGIAVSPWLIRNQITFHGQVLYSTMSGIDAVHAVIAPQGRALPGDEKKIETAGGWNLGKLETNDPSRLRLPSEAEINREGWSIARGLWGQWGWRLLPLELAKCSYFWLSTDQIFWTQSFSLRQRLVRWGGVIVYWVFLGLGIAGWFRTRRSMPILAHAFLLYAVLLTLLHLPFPMITRLRIPFMDPLITILAGGACWR
jgi:4-amino-4-deoxy-L-arabinose transferase-like glycosyltransferase